jgi:hypothetical protein
MNIQKPNTQKKAKNYVGTITFTAVERFNTAETDKTLVPMYRCYKTINGGSEHVGCYTMEVAATVAKQFQARNFKIIVEADKKRDGSKLLKYMYNNR